MESRIGSGLKGAKTWVAAVIGLAAVGIDLAQGGATAYSIPRIGLGVAVLIFMASLAGNDRCSVGFTLRARPSWSFWPKCTMFLGGFVLAGSLMVSAGLWMFDALPPLQSDFHSKDQIVNFLWQGCLWAPIEEELLYRGALCVPLAALIGRRWTVLVAGLTFAALHYVYGNLGVNHVFAGFVMGWAYLRSGSLLVPILLHSLGNLSVWFLHVGL
ncbi:MAG: CPBP family intramembrane metalloprotease, partial [bacterium]|nr:CPBP family intramembrane metalloprotease [bacterium]